MPPALVLKAACLTAMSFAVASTASAGVWRLDPKRCPDLVEDRLDQRITTSHRDAREDFKDMREVNCPVSAWTYTPAKDEKRKDGPRIYTGPVTVYAGRGGYYQFVAQQERRANQPALIKIVVR